MTFRLIKKIFIKLLSGIVNASTHTKYVFLSNQKCGIQPTLINLHPNEYSQELDYYPFAVKLDKCAGNCNTLNYLSKIACVSNKTEYFSIHDFNMIKEKNESKILTKYIACEWKCRFDGKKYISDLSWNNDIYVSVSVKSVLYVKKIIFGILLHVVFKIGNTK